MSSGRSAIQRYLEKLSKKRIKEQEKAKILPIFPVRPATIVKIEEWGTNLPNRTPCSENLTWLRPLVAFDNLESRATWQAVRSLACGIRYWVIDTPVIYNHPAILRIYKTCPQRSHLRYLCVCRFSQHYNSAERTIGVNERRGRLHVN